jgi:hypothetical protein
MQQYRLPAQTLTFAFVVFQSVVMVIVLLINQFADPIIALQTGIKVVGTSAVLAGAWDLFRRRLWRYSVFRKVGLVNFPDLNGIWDTVLRYENRVDEIPGWAEIKQSYTSISVTYYGQISQSYSIAATLARSADEDGDFQLIATFQNHRTQKLTEEKSAQHFKGHKDHRGTMALNIHGSKPNSLEGKLWTEDPTLDPAIPLESHGYMTFKRRESSKQ